ncbi:MAG: carboxypeptidase-like regulatory domain-containing protein [Acidobacteriota bacterium]
MGRGANTDPELYITTYYPRTLDVSAATPLELVPGSEMRGIDIGLLKGRTYVVSGVIEGVPSTPAPAQNQDKANAKQKGKQFAGGFGGIQATLVPRSNTGGAVNALDVILGGGNAQVNPDGSFTVRGVRPGAYYLMADSRGPQQNRLSARVAVDVAGGDVTGVHARLTPPNQLTGRVAPDKADSSLNLAQVRLNFVSSAPGGRGNQSQRLDVAADGKFETLLSSDTYTIEVQGAANGYYLKAVRLGGRELPDNTLDLSFTGGQLDVVLANDSGSITGTVQQSNGDPVQSARVTVVPANGSNRRDLYKTANSAMDGTFTIAGLPPGSYKVFAWEEVEQNAWMDPDFRRPFETLGTNAAIRDSAGPNLTLRVITREQTLAVQ